MQCHYEVLSVGKEATDDEIKKSYRKLALVWHPDKNPDKTEESTKRFLLIQQAYDVLIDPQERAWYDKHREAILRGGLGRGDDYEDNSVDLYKFFNASCFTGYGDDDCGFYSVYAQVFKSISAEDSEFLDLEAGTTLAPEFGSSQNSYEEVVGPFYAYWESYCTAKSYVWAEKYDTRDAPNRQVRRLMEQDNKKLRDKAKKERNEEVRTLVAFVRKRDKRVQAYKKKLEERATEIAKLAEQRKQRDREERLKILENYKESQWSSMTALEHELQSLEANYAKQFGEEVESEEDEEDEGNEAAADASSEEIINGEGEAEVDDYDDLVLDDALYCVACDKVFKSDKALDNHKRSKKHNENIERLRAELMDDENRTTDGNVRSNRSDEKADDDEETVNLSVSKSKSKKQKKKRKQMQKTQQNLCEGDDEDEDNNANVINDSSSLKNEKKEENEVSESCSESINQPSLETCSEAKPVKEEPGSKSKKRESKQKPSKTKAVPLTCNRCHEEFQSRNKLFEHITATGHELHLANESSSSAAAAATTERSGASQKTKGKQKRKT